MAESVTMIRDHLPTSGRPSGPAPRPAPEATYDLAWRYGRDVARLHMVDPEKLFFFWEVTDETARRAAGRPGRLSVRLVRLPGREGGAEHVARSSEGVFAVMNWYFDVEPLGRYRAEVGWLGTDGTFEPWLVSNTIDTPRLAVNVTGEVVWRMGGLRAKDRTRSTPRGEGVLGPEDHPSARPIDAASAARARKSAAIREVTRQAWSGSVTAWSRTAMPPRPRGDEKSEGGK